MRKEIIFAIVAGVAFGLVIAFGIWKADSITKPQSAQVSEEPNQEGTGTPVPISQDLISLASPREQEVINENPITLNGITTPNSWLVVYHPEEGETFFPTDSKGEFKAQIELTAGINLLQLYAFDASGNLISRLYPLVYSSEFVKETDDTNDQATSSSEMTENVKERLEEAKSIPLSYIGTITDISDTTIQIGKHSFSEEAGTSGEILQIAISENTSYVSLLDKAKAIKISDVAIGDFMVGMGYVNGKEVLNARRVLITTKPKLSSKTVIMAKINSVSKTSIKAQTLNNSEEVELFFDKNTDIFTQEDEKTIDINYDDLLEDDTIIAIATEQNNSFLASSIFVIPNKQATPTKSPTPRP